MSGPLLLFPMLALALLVGMVMEWIDRKDRP